MRNQDKKKKGNRPSRQRKNEREREGFFGVACPVGVDPLFLPSLFFSTPHFLVLPSRQLSADCLGFVVPIRPIALCFHQTQHLSYHCLDNCLLVQKSLQALCSLGDDMVTLPGSSEPPAEIAGPFPFLLSPCSSLCLPLCPSFCCPSAPPLAATPLPGVCVCVCLQT